MKFPQCALVAALLSLAASAQTAPGTIDVGQGSPTDGIRQQFVFSYYRNGFSSLTTLPPLGQVKKFGTAGLVQEFSEAANATVKWALLAPNASAPVAQDRPFVLQVTGAMYAYYNSVGSGTAGMPLNDTTNCARLAAANSCIYQFFDKNYALFVFSNLVNLTATTFFTRDPYYTKWLATGGLSVLGPAESAETAVTSSTAATATMQTFDQGAIFNFTTGLNAGRQIAVKQPVWGVYVANGLVTGALGLPVGEEYILPNGHKRQPFESGTIEYDPATQTAFLRAAVASVAISSVNNPVKLKVNETATLTAEVTDTTGTPAPDRAVIWTTSNSRIASVQSAGATATVKGTGGGTATIQAISEGKTSPAVTIVVTATCCQIGEGAPTAAIALAFQDAVTRNKLNIKLPAAGAVTRAGAGYMQTLEAADGKGTTYIIAVPDSVRTGFALSGRILTRYNELGGPTGSLGYPISDPTATGRQLFEHGALAGDPLIMVSDDILAKWAVLGYETGLAGAPSGTPMTFLTFRGSHGIAQSFQKANIYAVASGASSKTYAVSGLILARYAAAGGAAGKIGAPTDDEYGINGRRKQDFEGGSIDYAPGDGSAQLTETARQPLITASPASVVAGTVVRLSAGGFADNATVQVSVSGQTDFTVQATNGVYVWDVLVPPNAKSGPVTVRAVDRNNPSLSAQGSYTVRATADVHLQFKAIAGDSQVGTPGARLPLPLQVVLTDEAGNPVPNVPVEFSASPGAQLEAASAITDGNGEASARLRMPSNGGLALVNVTAAKLVVTFNARTASVGLANFPKQSQAVGGTLGSSSSTIAANGALLTSAAMILRYYQSRSELSSTSGLADPVVLNDYLKSVCIPDAQGAQLCDGYLTAGGSPDPIVNLWRLSGFAGNAVDVSIEKADLATVKDLVGQGSPVLLALSLTNGGSHFVVATGVGADGNIAIADPNPVYGRSALNDYLGGFTAGGQTVKATLTGAARLVPRVPKTGGFVVAVNAAVEISSPSGSCGQSFEFAGAKGIVRLRACDGADAQFQLDLTSATPYQGTLTDLGNPGNRVDLSGSGATTFKIARKGAVWAAFPMDVAIAAGGIVSAASFAPGVAPGAIATVFGNGFGRSGSPVTVEVGGVQAVVLASFPFQVNFQIPPATPAGVVPLKITSEAGTASQDLSVATVAPAIFLIGPSQGAVTNQNGTLNSATNPESRGRVLIVYATGLGTVAPKGNLMVADTPVTATLGRRDALVAFAGLAPGFIGLNQVNVNIPGSLPPGLAVELSIKQANSTSNTVVVAIQ